MTKNTNTITFLLNDQSCGNSVVTVVEVVHPRLKVTDGQAYNSTALYLVSSGLAAVRIRQNQEGS